ncbi:hypothetical protein CesoFtcFv8_023698 [Champsocephalus esox]|uniref:Adenomatous polyposis coli N-terminal dimerisation domain-containing protein n=1 Tax=Champsocephalus esox TaxID=159716 RepID=A0AAN8B4D3_9TELE|nr:hypothetical protein CesoFtcFv8_023698 [Champsocephalus esox]
MQSILGAGRPPPPPSVCCLLIGCCRPQLTVRRGREGEGDGSDGGYSDGVGGGSSVMAAASYDQLLRQVEVLKMENSTLRQELQDNSNHLTHLESEAENMKEVLKQLQGTIEEESGEASGSQLELIERLKERSLDSSGF